MNLHEVEGVNATAYHDIIIQIHISLSQASLLNHVITEAFHFHCTACNDAMRDNDIFSLCLCHNSLHHTATLSAELMTIVGHHLRRNGNSRLRIVIQNGKGNNLLFR